MDALVADRHGSIVVTVDHRFWCDLQDVRRSRRDAQRGGEHQRGPGDSQENPLRQLDLCRYDGVIGEQFASIAEGIDGRDDLRRSVVVDYSQTLH